MALADNIAADYQHVDGIETVTHTVKMTGTATNTVQAHREDLSFREIATGGPAGIEPGDIVWVVWSQTVATDPVGGDTITDSEGVVWTVKALTETSIGTTSISWRCVCGKQV